MKCEVTSIRIVKNHESARKAYATVIIDNAVSLNDVAVVKGKRGLFVSMPQKECTDENGEKKYANIYNPITKEARDELVNTVLRAYYEKLGEEENILK